MPLELDVGARSEAMRNVLARLRDLDTEEGRMKAYKFKPKPDDVFIVTPPKAGTTWMQQICHGLRTGGSMDFDEISLVIPHIELAHDAGYTDLDKEQVAEPRMYKTHFWYDHTPKGARYIFVARDPKDMALSFFHFLQGWFFEEGEISLEMFLQEFVFARGRPEDVMNNASFWENIASWWPHRKDPNVLWLHFEDLKEDLPGCVKLVAEFIGVGADDKNLQELVVKQAGFQFMKQHASKFDEHPLKLARNGACGLPERAGLDASNAGKVREGKVGDHRESIPPHMLKEMEERWIRDVTPVCGYQSYQEMREGANRELNRPFAQGHDGGQACD